MPSRRPLLTTAVSAALTIAVSAPPASATTSDASRLGYADATVSGASVVVPMVFPVVGGVSYSDTFLACRSGCSRQHFGQDLMSPRMRPLVAVFNGTVRDVRRETAPGGGNYITLVGDNGWSANYLHMNNDTPGTDDGRGTDRYAFAPGIRSGLRVVQGQLLGWSGDSGNSEGTAPHTHFELRKGEPWSGVVYNPKPSLDRAVRITGPRTAGPHPDGLLVRDARFGPAWLIDGGTRRLIPTAAITLNGYRLSDVIPVQAAELEMYPRGADVPLRDGLVVRGPDGALWVVADGERVRVPAQSLASVGVAADRIRVADAESLARTPVASDQTLPGVVREGALLRAEGAATLWLVRAGRLTAVPDLVTLNSWGIAHQDAWTVPADALAPPADRAGPSPDPDRSPSPGPSASPDDSPSPGPSPDPDDEPDQAVPLLPRDGTLLREPTGATWLVDDGVRRLIPSGAVLHAYAMGAVTKRAAHPALLARLPQGRDFP